MRFVLAAGCAASLGLCVAGCSVNMGNAPSFTATAPQPAPIAPDQPPAVVYGSFLEGPVGMKLTPASRDKALAAEQGALASGQRKSWKGDNGTFGFVEPAPGPAAPKPVTDPNAPPPSVSAGDAGAESCRSFTSTIFIGGHPQTGHGRGCQNPDGTYRIVG